MGRILGILTIIYATHTRDAVALILVAVFGEFAMSGSGGASFRVAPKFLNAIARS